MLLSLTLERALRWAATCHQGQVRRGSNAPYVEHLVGVAWMLDRLGYPEHVVIAGLLHDVVEDTPATLAEVEASFGADVAAIVGHCSEVKLDEAGAQRPWADRKRDHLAALTLAPAEARAVALADKVHNLLSIALDLREGRDVWSQFHADRARVLAYYLEAIRTLGSGDARLSKLSAEATELLALIGD
ncbi:HD domain-containing protein [Isosphaeraceae bacterium EP7]